MSGVDEYEWLRILIDSIENESELCTMCLNPPEVRSYITPAGLLRFRIRYQCDAQSSTTKLYSTSGETVGVCIVDTINRNCEFDPDFTGYTFGREITTIWTCADGFDCTNAPRETIFSPYSIEVSGNPCEIGTRTMSTSELFESYLWTDPSGLQSTDSQSIATVSGTYELIVTDENGCMDTTEFFVGTGQDIIPQIEGNTTICDDGGVLLSVEGFESVLWSDGQTQAAATFFEPGTVSAIVQYTSGCIDTAYTTIKDGRGQSVKVSLPERDIYEGQSIELTIVTVGFDIQEAMNIVWMVNGEYVRQSAQLTLKVNEPTIVVLQVTSSGGCMSEDEIVINPLPVNRNIYFSSAFNPSSNVGNDRFFPQSIEGTIEVRDLFVYDRWGSMVHSDPLPVLNDRDSGWDGTMAGEILPPGIYIYKTDIHYADGSTKMIAGTVQIIR